MARMSCSHFFVAWLVHTPFVCVIALLVHLRQVHPLYVRYCFVGAAETAAPPDAYSTSNLPLWSTTYLLPVPPTRMLALNW